MLVILTTARNCIILYYMVSTEICYYVYDHTSSYDNGMTYKNTELLYVLKEYRDTWVNSKCLLNWRCIFEKWVNLRSIIEKVFTKTLEFIKKS